MKNSIQTWNRLLISGILILVITTLFPLKLIHAAGSDPAITKGERPKIDLATIPLQAFEQNIIRIRFNESLQDYLDNAVISNNPDGTVRFGIAAIDQLNQQFGVFEVKKTFETVLQNTKFSARHRLWGFHLWYDLIVPPGTDIKSMVLAYAKKNEIQVSEPVFKKQLIGADINDLQLQSVPDGNKGINYVPNDPRYTEQWHYNNTGQQSGTPDADIDLPEAWEITKGSSNVIVAIIDQGIEYTHTDLAANMWPGIGYNFVTNTSTISPGDHGSHVAGTIAANTNNAIGVSGIAGGTGTGNGVRLMSCQVFTSSSSGGFENAPIWAADNGAAISQNSWGYTSVGVYDQAVLDAIDYFNTNGGGSVLSGGITIFAAGNNSSSGQWYPGCYSGAFAIAATNNQDLKSWYSNFDTWVDISAPGGETNTVTQRGVLSCLTGNSYGFYQGTSMACPHTSGVAALMISLAPGILTAQNVRDILSSTTDNINSLNPTYVGKMGTGRLNAYQALLATQEYIALTAKFTASPTLVCTGNAVTFTDLSLASPTSWLWSFPGGTPSAYNGQNPPAVIYPAAGVFDVSLTVSDGTTTDTETKTGYITVQNIIAGFTGTPTSVVVGNPVTFTDNSMCSPTSWSWSFPGGTPSSSTLQNPPPVTYSTLGTYDVSLSVTKSGKTDVETKTGYISVISPEFIMSNGTISTCSGNFYDPGGASGSYSNSQDFTMVFNPGSPGNKLRFIFNSFDLEAETSCGYDYLKIYNGNSTSSPLIGTYCGTNSPGTITASGATGSLTFVFHSDNYVVATGWSASIICISTTAPPVAGFVASTINPAINSTVVFTDQTINFPTSWAWSFTPNNVVYMNGTNAGSQNPQVQFTATGNYNVSLTVANAYGTDNETKTNYISVANCTPCSSSSSNASEEWISNVSFNTINNNSGGSAGYQDFTAISTTVKPGSVYNLSASCGSTGSWAEHCLAFFDWNHDCDFTDAGESFDLGQVTGPGTMNANITIPAGTADGLIRMRVSLKYNGDPTSCETLTYGQVEDYTVIVQNPSLSVTPSNQNVTAPAGNTSFGVTSNSVWTVASNQVWCAVTTSGSGNGTITATYLQNTSLSPRIANITVTVAGLSPVVVTVTQAGVPCFDPTAYAGADVTICENESYTIAGATAANFGALLWTGGFGSFDNPTQLLPVYTPGINEYGTPVALTLTAQPVSPCSFVASDQMTIFIQKLPTTDAGADATIIETESLQLSAVADNYAGIFWTSTGDGYFDDPDILNPVYFPGVMDIQNSTVDLYLTAMPHAVCTFESVDVLTLTIMRQQMLSLPAGWSGFSSFIVPQNPAFDEFMAPVAGDLVVVKTITQVYWPMFEVNTIGNFQVLQGYIVKMNAQASLPVTGFKSVDKTINLVTGWNILPVVSENETGYQELLTQLGGNLVIVKEIAGGLILWPEAGVYSLATLVPGKAYMIKVSAECSFTFPD